TLIVLGDIKDAITKVSSEVWQEIPKFFETIQQNIGQIQVVLGNHDGNLEPLLPKNVELIPASGKIFGDVGLFHGHAWPTPDILGCKSLITGHVHPTIAIRDPMGLRVTRQVLVKTACEKEKLAKSLLKYLDIKPKTDVSDTFYEKFKVKLGVSQLFILPSFNQFLGGRAINEKKKQTKKTESYIGPILRSGCVDMDGAEVFLLDGTFLGTVEHLKKLS
ncbi:MAG: hypothetical protein NWF03_01535, partial [Candidatus Bathyarchaeota archaeon]|nr:hypothetical protein [Candidatus Bathyarchaeota archaeon]